MYFLFVIRTVYKTVFWKRILYFKWNKKQTIRKLKFIRISSSQKRRKQIIVKISVLKLLKKFRSLRLIDQ